MSINLSSITKIVLFTILALFSCNNTDTKLTIPEDKLLKVFYDIYAADYVIKEAPKDTRDSLKEVYTNQIFKIHDISKSEFEANLSQLKNNPQRFKKFYDKLDKYGEKLSKDSNYNGLPK